MTSPAASAEEKPKGAFAIFRSGDAPELTKTSSLRFEGITPVISAGLAELAAAGIEHGREVRVLFETPGFSLAYAWFKSGYPLALHSHDVDCLYYIVSGSIRLGTEALKAGDGFFVPASTPYTYTPGADGVEILEFRNAVEFDMRYLAKGAKYWEKAAALVRDSQDRWSAEKRPPLNV